MTERVFEMRERLQRIVDEADKALGGFGGYPPSFKWTDAFIDALAADGLALVAVPDTEKGAELVARSAQDADTRGGAA